MRSSDLSELSFHLNNMSDIYRDINIHTGALDSIGYDISHAIRRLESVVGLISQGSPFSSHTLSLILRKLADILNYIQNISLVYFNMLINGNTRNSFRLFFRYITQYCVSLGYSLRSGNFEMWNTNLNTLKIIVEILFNYY